MVKPLKDYIVIKKDVFKDEKKIGKIIIQTTKKEEGNEAIIVAVGPEVKDKNLEVNKRVIYKEFSTTTYVNNDEEFLLIKEENILAVVE